MTPHKFSPKPVLCWGKAHLPRGNPEPTSSQNCHERTVLTALCYSKSLRDNLGIPFVSFIRLWNVFPPSLLTSVTTDRTTFQTGSPVNSAFYTCSTHWSFFTKAILELVARPLHWSRAKSRVKKINCHRHGGENLYRDGQLDVRLYWSLAPSHLGWRTQLTLRCPMSQIQVYRQVASVHAF